MKHILYYILSTMVTLAVSTISIASTHDNDILWISSCDEYIEVINDANNLSKNIALSNSFSCQGKIIKPFGDEETGPFYGTFDGNGKVISDVVVRAPENKLYLGLIGWAINATIKNLTLKNINVQGKTKYIGGLLGFARWRVNIKNVSIEDGVIHSTDSQKESSYIGGMIGQLYINGRIKKSSSDVSISAKEYYQAGGMIGSMQGSQVSDSYSRGSIYATNIAGGLIGQVGSTYDDTRIERSYSETDIVSTISGGLAGIIQGVTINNSYATGAVNGANAGGLVAFDIVLPAWRINIITNSYATGLVSSNSSRRRTGGLMSNSSSRTTVHDSYWDKESTRQENSSESDPKYGKTTAQMRQQGTYEKWDFDTIWFINPTINNGYPALRTLEEK